MSLLRFDSSEHIPRRAQILFERLVFRMPEGERKVSRIEKILMDERFMAVTCFFVVASSLISLFFTFREGDSFGAFALLIKAVTAAGMFLAFHFFKWDVAKGLMGGVLFCLMYQEAYQVFVTLWGEKNYDVYLTAGIEGSLFLAGAGMNFVMTVVITINHFMLSYATHGSEKNVILAQIAIIFKFLVYLLLVYANRKLTISQAMQWNNSLQFLTDRALLVLLIGMEALLNSFNTMRQDLLRSKRERRQSK